MAIEIKAGNSTDILSLDAYLKSARVSVVPRGAGYSVSGVTGTITAALAANSCVFAMRNSPTSSRNILISRIILDYTTIVAFTTPVTAGRRLGIFRGAGAAATGGTAIPAAMRKLSTSPPSSVDAAQGGDARIATTGALTVTGITFEALEHSLLHLAGFGNAGNTVRQVFVYDSSLDEYLTLRPGELIGVRNPVAMDAGGTWQLGVTVNFVEVQ